MRTVARRTPFWENKVKPALDEVLKGKTMSMANDRFDVLRDGYVEEAYYTYSLSPVYNCRKEIIAIYDTVRPTMMPSFLVAFKQDVS